MSFSLGAALQKLCSAEENVAKCLSPIEVEELEVRRAINAACNELTGFLRFPWGLKHVTLLYIRKLYSPSPFIQAEACLQRRGTNPYKRLNEPQMARLQNLNREIKRSLNARGLCEAIDFYQELARFCREAGSATPLE